MFIYFIVYWPLGVLSSHQKHFEIHVDEGKDNTIENTLRHVPEDFTADMTTLDQVVALCHQTTGNIDEQNLSRSMMSYSTTKPHS